ncbi:MAG: fibronectin type III domain-containing protein, partial [Candidatus Aenigmatarchaeota archaeon]
YQVSSCTLDSVSIAPTACTKNINQCTSAGTACGAGDGITVTAKYTGLNCPKGTLSEPFTVQVDAKSSDNLCNVQGSGGQMTGISISCSNPTPLASQQTCTGTWQLRQSSTIQTVPSACQQKTITAYYTCINGQYCVTPTIPKHFDSCKDTVIPVVSVLLDKHYAKPSDVITSTLSGVDNTYGLRSCTLNWGDSSTTTQPCDATLGTNCNNKFTSLNTHSYASDGSKTVAFSCENLNGNPGVTGSSSDSVTICSSIADVSGMNIYDSSSKTKTLLQSTWQNDNTPYFEWTPVTSACGVTYEVQIDSNALFDVTTNYYSATFTDGQHQIKFTSKDNAGNRGVTQTYNYWADTVAPTTSIVETIPTWFTTVPTILHLTCSDVTSSCTSTLYYTIVCISMGCSFMPPQSYNPLSGVSLWGTSTLFYKSTDSAGNTESWKSQTIKIDASKPTTPTVSDSGVWTATTNSLFASWSASSDPESGISEYQISVGTTAGGTDVKSYTSVGTVLFTTVTGLNLLDSVKYYINVRAKNNAGLFSDPGSSDGITVHTGGPAGINDVYVERMFGKYISANYKIYTGSLTDPTGISSCSYTIDGSTWNSATYDSPNKICTTGTLTCNDGDVRTIKMKALNVLGTVSETVTPLVKICDAIAPNLISFNPPAGSSPHTSSKNPVFTLNTMDAKSGVAKIEWNLYLNGVVVPGGIVTKNCDGGEGVTVACTISVSELTTSILKNGDVLYVKAKADDHVDPWSGYGNSGQWVIDENAPDISTITPTVATLGVSQDYSATVKAQSGKTIASCDLLANGIKIDDMALTSGTTTDGTWTGQYVIATPSIVFMRARCTDNAGNQGNGVDILVSLASTVSSTVVPSPVDKADTLNITANYRTVGGSAITGGKCWISSSTFNDPSRGIVGAVLQDLNNGYYTYSFEAPIISGSYAYTVSCYKNGYQTTSDSGSFNVLGCDGTKCIKLTPTSMLAILSLGETQSFDLLLKNRDDSARTYSISVLNLGPWISIVMSPSQVTLSNGEEKKVSVRLTSLEITDQQIIRNILVKNVDPAKPGDSALSRINVSVAIGSVPSIGFAGIMLLFTMAALMVYRKVL